MDEGGKKDEEKEGEESGAKESHFVGVKGV